jgi:hypothetical protein
MVSEKRDLGQPKSVRQNNGRGLYGKDAGSPGASVVGGWACFNPPPARFRHILLVSGPQPASTAMTIHMTAMSRFMTECMSGLSLHNRTDSAFNQEKHPMTLNRMASKNHAAPNPMKCNSCAEMWGSRRDTERHLNAWHARHHTTVAQPAGPPERSRGPSLFQVNRDLPRNAAPFKPPAPWPASWRGRARRSHPGRSFVAAGPGRAWLPAPACSCSRPAPGSPRSVAGSGACPRGG